MKNLPIGLQSIKDLIEQDFAYVDKTGILYQFVQKKGYYFLSRPRRFGKSLTCSTLEAIFEGKRDLFQGLAISKVDYDWKKYPIVRLDFNEIAHQSMSDLNISMKSVLRAIARDHQIDISGEELPKDKLRFLITELAKKYKSSVVVIIDEYDKPILDHIHNKELAAQMRDFLKSFYGVFKGKDIDTNLRFLFMTGVSKFSKVSIFSELNNLQDLTLDERMADLCGYTQEELELVFDEHIQAFAQHTGKTKQDMLSELKKWYNGFQFSKIGTRVYNPFSILNCLDKKDFANYWFSSGTPTFIMKFAKNNPLLVKKLIMLENEALVATDFECFSIETYFENILILFYQAGYLTISNFNPKTGIFQLGYPNLEVRNSMSEQLFNFLMNIERVELSRFVGRFTNALSVDDIDLFCVTMRDFFTLLPHTIIIDREKFYQGIFFTVAKLLGADVDAEHATSMGYIDLIIEGLKNTYIIEFKKDKTPDVALAQIEGKEYFAKFKIDGSKPVVLVGINFDLDEKGVRLDWKIKKI